MARRLKYAMVGGARGAFIGPIHRMAIRMDDLADLVAGNFSRDPKKNAATGAKLRVARDRVYGDWRSLIAAEKGKIDFLSVCTTNETHYEIAKAALEAGIDVFCEKPLSLSVREAEKLGKLAEKHRRFLGIPFTYTGYPMIRLARDLVSRGELGRIDKVTIEYMQGSFRKIDFSKPLDAHNSWKMNPLISGPSCVVADIGVHAFTLLEYVTGLEVESLLADLSSFAPGNRLDDDASILMRLSDRKAVGRGAVPKASLDVSKIATGEENGVRLRVYGDRASLHWDQESPNFLTVKYPKRPDAVYRRKAPYVAGISPAANFASRFPAGHHEGFVEALATVYDEFVAAVLSRKERDFPGARSGIRSMRFVEAALKSAKKGCRWVKL